MKKSIIYAWIPFLLFTSCNSFLDLPPLDAIDNDAYWKKSRDLENYVIKYYPGLPRHGTYGGGFGYPVSNSDDAIDANPDLVMNGVSGAAAGRWTSDWAQIRSVNIFFDNYRKCEEDFALYRHYVGEAHFFRAWFYFELVKKYGDIPWYSSALTPDMEDQLLKPRTPRNQVVDSIIADLDKAFDYLEYRSTIGNSRLNKETALAFKSRVALFEGTWQKYHATTGFGTAGVDPNSYFQLCINASEELMNNAQYQAGIYEDYYTMFGVDDMSSVNEILFYRASSTKEGLGNDMQYATILYPAERGVTWSLVSSYLGKDGKPYDYESLASVAKGSDFLQKIAEDVDPRLYATIWTPGALQVSLTGLRFDKPSIADVGLSLNPTGFQIKKGSNPNSSGAGIGGGGNSETGYIYFRLGEVLLNYAEARYERHGIVDYSVLNRLRSRVNMSVFTVNSQSSDPNLLDYGYPISDELYEIRRERRVELALEGHRADDYRRWAAHTLFKGIRPMGYPFNPAEFPATFNPALDEKGRIDYFKSKLPNGYGFRANQDYLSPIPIEELTLNPALVQNPNW